MCTGERFLEDIAMPLGTRARPAQLRTRLPGFATYGHNRQAEQTEQKQTEQSVASVYVHAQSAGMYVGLYSPTVQTVRWHVRTHSNQRLFEAKIGSYRSHL